MVYSCGAVLVIKIVIYCRLEYITAPMLAVSA